MNLSGTVGLEAARSRFAGADAALAELLGRADAVLVDMHVVGSHARIADKPQRL